MYGSLGPVARQGLRNRHRLGVPGPMQGYHPAEPATSIGGGPPPVQNIVDPIGPMGPPPIGQAPQYPPMPPPTMPPPAAGGGQIAMQDQLGEQARQKFLALALQSAMPQPGGAAGGGLTALSPQQNPQMAGLQLAQLALKRR